MDAAHRAGLWWPTICGGEGSCTTCVCELLSGAGGLAAMTLDESEAIGRISPTGQRHGRPLRLACQAEVVQDVDVFKRGVKPAATPVRPEPFGCNDSG